MSAKYAREVEDLETQIRRKDREKRGLEDELRDSREELARERETIRELKVSSKCDATGSILMHSELWPSNRHNTSRSMLNLLRRKHNKRPYKPKSSARLYMLAL